MRKTLLLLFALCFFAGNSQIENSSCENLTNMDSLYKRDAAKLAVARAFKTNSTYKDSVVIDQATYSRYLGALLAIYNATALPIGDTIYRLNLHASLSYKSAKEIIITSDSTFTWVQNIRNNIIPCGNAAVDNLLAKYYLSKKFYYSGGYLVLKSDSVFNMYVLAGLFNAIPSVTANLYGDIQTFIQVDGCDIKDSVNTNFIGITYIKQWGDCPSGCMCTSIWKFKVYNNCWVEYLGHSGCSVSDFVTGISTVKEWNKNIKIFPNPVIDKLVIQNNGTGEQYGLVITDLMGQAIKQFTSDKKPEFDRYQVDLSDLPSGVYFLKVENSQGQGVFKIVKE